MKYLHASDSTPVLQLDTSKSFGSNTAAGSPPCQLMTLIGCRDTCDESASPGVIDAIDVKGKTTMTTIGTASPVKQGEVIGWIPVTRVRI